MNQKLADLDFCKKPLQSSENKKKFPRSRFENFYLDSRQVNFKVIQNHGSLLWQ